MEIIITIKIIAELRPEKSLIQIYSEKLDNWIKSEDGNKL